MSRDGMPRAYLRIDPNIDHTHPDLATFVRLLCAAARQPDRGRFRDRAQLTSLMGKARVHAMYARADVVDLEDGRVYVVGWDEWQEGDLTVAERMRRMRARRSGNDVTPPPSHHRNVVTTDAYAVASSNVTEEERAREIDPAVSLNERTGRYPSEGTLRWLNDLSRSAGAGDLVAGDKRLAALIDSTPMLGTNVGDYMRLLGDLIRRQDREAERLERAEEVKRNEGKRAPVVLQVVDGERDEEAEREYLKLAKRGETA